MVRELDVSANGTTHDRVGQHALELASLPPDSPVAAKHTLPDPDGTNVPQVCPDSTPSVMQTILPTVTEANPEGWQMVAGGRSG